MVVNKRGKSPKRKGSQTNGWGRKSKHRSAGNKSGRGRCGLTGKRGHVKKPTYLKMRQLLQIPRATKRGFKRHSTVITRVNPISLRDLLPHLDQLVSEKKAEKKGDTYVVDLNKLGFNKLLSNGTCSVKLDVTCDTFSAKAAEKVQAAGGKITSPQAAPKEAPAKEKAPKQESAEDAPSEEAQE